jgi:hypothetical protein
VDVIILKGLENLTFLQVPQISGGGDEYHHCLVARRIRNLWGKDLNPGEHLLYTVIIRRISDGYDSNFPVSHRVWCMVGDLPTLGICRAYVQAETTILEVLNPYPMIIFIWILQHRDPERALPSHLAGENLDEVEHIVYCCGQQREIMPYLSVYYQQQIFKQGHQNTWRLGNAIMAAFWKGDHGAFERATKLYIQRLSIHEWQLDEKHSELLPELILSKYCGLLTRFNRDRET